MLTEVREAYYFEEQNLRLQSTKLEMAMNITEIIVPKHSIGGICIGTNIKEIETAISDQYTIHKNQNSLSIENGFITAYHGAGGIISSLSCNQLFTGNYQNKLWAGMTVADVLNRSKEQIAWSGFVQVDKISGIGLSLPEDRDDFELLTDHFELDFIFEELWVYSF
ncbi:hypothetical protein [Pseudomonas sp. RGM2987]|uniref:hypothetical protein n=1 Tax=Pseudomonas sp. RGM2987 TaxID=2930090 RepID=UPI001FD6E14D|nr:hypothetical protein [Pseudomonas sp. RGM2987]MCJ8203080.1 hypothetical protein [Pseudomonas sp. RGM2987]